MDGRAYSGHYGDAFPAEPEQRSWFVRASVWLEAWARPYLGWAILLLTILVALLPAYALRVNHWLALGRSQLSLELVGPLGVLAVWFLMGWRQPRRLRWPPVVKTGLAIVVLVVLGAVLLSHMMTGWLPGVVELGRALINLDAADVVNGMASDLIHLNTRYALWWQGVLAGGAGQDNLVFVGFAGIILWITGVGTAWLVRRFEQGFLAAAPALWLLTTILLYSNTGRWVLVAGLGIAIALHLLLDHESLQARWRIAGLDYSQGLFIDRLLAVMGAAVLVLVLAAITPNLYVRPLVVRYYEVMDPVNQRLEDLAERLFPAVHGASRMAGGGIAGGLPNEFLLSSGPGLSSVVVMRVRTNEPGGSGYQYPYDETPPPSHYMRGGTLTVYSGLGWSNPPDLARRNVVADEQLPDIGLNGRKRVLQSITLDVRSQVLYAAPEPIVASVDYRLATRGLDDLVALWASARSYTVESAVPAVNEAMLAAAPAWGEANPLPEHLQVHLVLPETITERTRQLAAQVTDGLESPYAKAHAIEAYLRTYTYDLTVADPPESVTDVADFFLFDSKRGYCDYYTTAFVVLARLAGMPARFATGFAPGSWDPRTSTWVVTEAEAHSWPEVYFPDYGWIPFEPTAARPELARIAAPAALSLSGQPVAVPTQPETETTSPRNWQPLIWIVLLAAGSIWLVRRGLDWAGRQADPWQGLLRWGSRIGRPMEEGETVLEYGNGLVDYLGARAVDPPDRGRIVGREVRALSAAVSALRYGPEQARMTLTKEATEHWERLRGYLRGLRVRDR
jgi:transglutaminase-like putative cysteine protease